MRLLSVLIFCWAFCSPIFAQTSSKYWVQFKDKEGTPYKVTHPEEFLSPRAIALRQLHRIPITTTDLPVSPQYVRQVLALDSSLYLCTTSKWLNGITVCSTNDSVADLIRKLPFVVEVECTSRMDTVEEEPILLFYYEDKNPSGMTYSWDAKANVNMDYGSAKAQVEINNAHWLHRMGYHGEGMQMMVMDAGFVNVDTISFFRTLRDDHRLLGARNFVQPDQDPFRKHDHGTMVLSCIASYNPGKLVGTAPMAQFYLCQTEDSRSETKVEEDNWVAGLEWADSLGCQVLNSSLGYTRFDDTVAQRRTYEDMNGTVSRASRAATIAALKGMIICNSAGNEGSSKWKYLGAPADANSILTVGAVMANGNAASFSSFGPTADGRVKPDACAIGLMASVCNSKGQLSFAAGTSFSSPLLSGMVACLWQAFPEKSNHEIMDAVRKSGSFYTLDKNPQMGYGITDFLKAYNILRQQSYSYPDAGVYFSDYALEKQKNGKWQTMATVYYSAPNNGSLSFEAKSGGKLKVKRISATTAGDAHVVCYLITFPPLKKGEQYRVEEMNVQCGGKPFSFVFGLE
ncbi:MAG: S8 family serine peptidase [Bacteroidales bacterium]|nr:S8 family serine peptidase [Bacteroidales bacterium]